MKICVIGVGYWGAKHARVFKELGHDVGVIDIDQRRQYKAAAQLGVSGTMNWEDADAVVVATPAVTHAALTVKILAAGKSVLCEKPLCIKPSDASKLADLALAKRCVLQVGHTYMFHPAVLRVKELLGEIGPVRCMSAVRTNLGPVREDVNVVLDLATHDVSIFNYWMGGPPTKVAAHGASFVSPGADVALITLRYSDVFASIYVNWLSPGKARQIVVTSADSRTLVMSETWDRRPLASYSAQGHSEWIHVESYEPLKAQNEAFIDTILGKRENPGNQADIDIVKTLAAINRSLALNGRMEEVS